MARETSFLTFWREADAELKARRCAGLPMGKVALYWSIGFSAAQAAEAEMLRASLFASRVLH